MELMTSCILHSQRQNREVGWGTESSGLSCHLGEPGAWLGDSLHSPPLSPHSSPADDQCHLLTDSITFSDILVTMLSVLATGCKLLLSPDSGHWDPGARKLLVLSGKEFKNGHRGDTSRNGFIYAKSKAKTLSRREGGKTQDSVVCCAGGPKTLSFYWCLWTWGWSVLENWWKTGLMCHQLPESGLCIINSSLMSGRGRGGQFLAWDGQTGAVIFLWAACRQDPVVCHKLFCRCQQSR
jgi:hypothetical protein